MASYTCVYKDVWYMCSFLDSISDFRVCSTPSCIRKRQKPGNEEIGDVDASIDLPQIIDDILLTTDSKYKM